MVTSSMVGCNASSGRASSCCWASAADGSPARTAAPTPVQAIAMPRERSVFRFRSIVCMMGYLLGTEQRLGGCRESDGAHDHAHDHEGGAGRSKEQPVGQFRVLRVGREPCLNILVADRQRVDQ